MERDERFAIDEEYMYEAEKRWAGAATEKEDEHAGP